MRQQIVIADYGMGNIHSIDKALRYVAPQSHIMTSQNPADIANADRVVFPGVGAIRDCMQKLRETGMDAAIRQTAKEKPLLAICVGMQALFGENEEDTATRGIGIIAGRVRRLTPTDRNLKIPHMGWNCVRHSKPKHPDHSESPKTNMWHGIAQDSRFYFVHSYYCEADDRDLRAGTCVYATEFDAAVQSGYIFAVQFHPEKSHKDGLQLLKNFIRWQGAAA